MSASLRRTSSCYSLHHRARERLAPVVKPLLDLISRYTGFSCVTLVAAGPNEERGSGFIWSAVHHGETKDIVPKNVATYDSAGFRKEFVGHFLKFVGQVAGPRGECFDTFRCDKC